MLIKKWYCILAFLIIHAASNLAFADQENITEENEMANVEEILAEIGDREIPVPEVTPPSRFEIWKREYGYTLGLYKLYPVKIWVIEAIRKVRSYF